jgi:peptidyl-lysine (3S)-dioxygenase / protease
MYGMESGHWTMEIKEEDGDKVPFATWDPDRDEGGDGYETRYSKYSTPVRVRLRKGDMVYLPALW